MNTLFSFVLFIAASSVSYGSSAVPEGCEFLAPKDLERLPTSVTGSLVEWWLGRNKAQSEVVHYEQYQNSIFADQIKHSEKMIQIYESNINLVVRQYGLRANFESGKLEAHTYPVEFIIPASISLQDLFAIRAAIWKIKEIEGYALEEISRSTSASYPTQLNEHLASLKKSSDAHLNALKNFEAKHGIAIDLSDPQVRIRVNPGAKARPAYPSGIPTHSIIKVKTHLEDLAHYTALINQVGSSQSEKNHNTEMAKIYRSYIDSFESKYCYVPRLVDGELVLAPNGKGVDPEKLPSGVDEIAANMTLERLKSVAVLRAEIARGQQVTSNQEIVAIHMGYIEAFERAIGHKISLDASGKMMFSKN